MQFPMLRLTLVLILTHVSSCNETMEEEQPGAGGQKLDPANLPSIEGIRATKDRKTKDASLTVLTKADVIEELHNSSDLENRFFVEPEAENESVIEPTACEIAGDAKLLSFTSAGETITLQLNGTYTCPIKTKYSDVDNEFTRKSEDVASFDDCVVDTQEENCELSNIAQYGLSTLYCKGADFSGVTMDDLNASNFPESFCGDSSEQSVTMSFDWTIDKKYRGKILNTDKAGCTNSSTDKTCYLEKEASWSTHLKIVQQTETGEPCEMTVTDAKVEYQPCLFASHKTVVLEGFEVTSATKEYFTEISMPKLKSMDSDKWYFGSEKAELKINDWEGEITFNSSTGATAPSYNLTRGSETIAAQVDVDPECYGSSSTRPATCPQ